METAEVVVVGAGVVGLAVARALALAGHQVFVVEQHGQSGQETSSRNSGVIHSGLYYSTNSLKSRLCVRGRELLYAYCAERDVAHRRCGKIIVASEAQVPALEALHRQGSLNGVTDLSMLTSAELREMEPDVRADRALFSPSTGIVDVHELLVNFEGDIEAHEGQLVFRTSLVAAKSTGRTISVTVDSDGTRTELGCQWLVNCAGLSAVPLLQRIEGYPEQRLRTAYYAKGNYFACHGRRPFRHLVYPMPNSAGLGIHATLDLDGTTRFGPDVEWVSSPNHDVDEGRVASFYAAIREYWPGIPAGCLQLAYAGVRPKLVGAGVPAADFEVEGPAEHGVCGLINLLGIESPGLTSSLAIGEYVAAILASDGGRV